MHLPSSTHFRMPTSSGTPGELVEVTVIPACNVISPVSNVASPPCNVTSPPCNVTSPSTDMEDFSFFLETEYGSISFQFKNGGFSLSFNRGFRIKDCLDDNPPKPTEAATEIENSSPPPNFEETSPPQTKATCDLPNDTDRTSPTMKRCNFPKKTTLMLKKWLSQNKEHPYPSDKEKCRLAGATNLSLRQVNDWMINARRRYLKSRKKYFGAK